MAGAVVKKCIAGYEIVVGDKVDVKTRDNESWYGLEVLEVPSYIGAAWKFKSVSAAVIVYVTDYVWIRKPHPLD